MARLVAKRGSFTGIIACTAPHPVGYGADLPGEPRIVDHGAVDTGIHAYEQCINPVLLVNWSMLACPLGLMSNLEHEPITPVRTSMSIIVFFIIQFCAGKQGMVYPGYVVGTYRLVL